LNALLCDFDDASSCRINHGKLGRSGPEKTYRTGENWTELPGDHHGVSANASETKPAKILALFVVDDQDAVLTITDKK
jgi:quercetin dioxygenase-like cupin family protein